MANTAIKQLERLQRSLYESAFEEARSLVAGASRTILKYSTEFERTLPRRITRSTQSDILDVMRQSQFILYGDFHTLRQSQRGLLRLIRAYIDRYKSAKVILALEMFKWIDQRAIDAYLAEEIEEDSFLADINYRTEWGFPWKNFRMILDYAKQKHIKVVGINTTNAGRDSLQERDLFAARCLAKMAQSHPDHKVICLIGEYHLADRHLPEALKLELKRRHSSGKTLRILNNIDEYYFKIPHPKTQNVTTEYLRLRKDLYCIMNSPPWMKWKSFSLWEEMQSSGPISNVNSDLDHDSDIDVMADDGFDVEFQLLHFIRSLADFIGVPIDASDIESFEIHYSPEGNFVEILSELQSDDQAQTGRIIERTGLDGIYYFSRSRKILISYVSINNLAEAAGQFLHHHLSGMDDNTGDPSVDFYRRMIKAATGMIGSKILNPRRKCWELIDAARYLKKHAGERLRGAAQTKRQIAKSSIQFHNWMQKQLKKTTKADFVRPIPSLIQIDADTHFALSRCLGQMLGLEVYKHVMANQEPALRIRRLFRHKHQSSAATWGEVLELFRTAMGE